MLTYLTILLIMISCVHMKSNIIKVVSVLIIVTIVIIIVSASQNGLNNGVIRIGALMPLTGGLSSYGEPAQKAAELAVADINANGGINGNKLEIVYEDHKCDPKEMVSVFEKTLSSGIHIMNSVACSGTVSSVAPSLVPKDVLLFGAVTSASKLTAISPNFFRNWASDRQEGKVLADQIIKKGYKSVAVLYEETDYAKGLKSDVENNLKGTDVKIVSESFASGSTDVRTQLAKLKSAKTDAVLISVQTVTSGEVVLSQMEQLNFKPKMLVNYNILASALVKTHASLLEGALGGNYSLKASDKLNKVLAEYKAKYGVDCPQKNVCAMEYDSIQFLAQALKAKGSSVSGVKDYLSKNTYDGVSGDISFDVNNDRTNTDYVPFEITGGLAVKIGE